AVDPRAEAQHLRKRLKGTGRRERSEDITDIVNEVRPSVRALQLEQANRSGRVAPTNIELERVVSRIARGGPDVARSHGVDEANARRHEGVHIQRLEELMSHRTDVRQIQQRVRGQFSL